MKYGKIALLSLNIFFITASLNPAYATAITTDLTLSAEIGFDLSVAPLNSTQDATIAIRSGGVDDTRSVSGTSVSGGSVPLMGTLSDLNDGISFTGSMIGTANSLDIADAVLFSDLFIDIENTSASTAYQLTFRVDYELTAETTGFDAISGASVNIFDTNSSLDIIFDEVISDTFFTPGLFTTGSVTSFFDVIIDPLSIVALSGAIGIDGLAFEIDDGFNIFNSTRIALTDAIALRSNVPEPSVLILFTIGLFSFRLFQHKKF